jgi:hypothetical protein
MAREHLPEGLAVLVPKGPRDCGKHEWYKAEEGIWRCYHCVVGVGRQLPWNEPEYEARLRETDAMRMRAGLDDREHFPVVQRR